MMHEPDFGVYIPGEAELQNSLAQIKADKLARKLRQASPKPGRREPRHVNNVIRINGSARPTTR